MCKRAIITICDTGGVTLTFDPPTERGEASFRTHLGVLGLGAITEECRKRGWLGDADEGEEEEYGDE